MEALGGEDGALGIAKGLLGGLLPTSTTQTATPTAQEVAEKTRAQVDEKHLKQALEPQLEKINEDKAPPTSGSEPADSLENLIKSLERVLDIHEQTKDHKPQEPPREPSKHW